MDETLRRRLVGAFVLLGVAFAVASALPDRADRPRGGGQVVTYDLETGNQIISTAPVQGVTPGAPPQATAPTSEGAAAPAAPEPAAPKLRLRTSDTLASVAPPVPPEPAPAAAPTPGGNWFVQIGSFGNQANARAVVQKLRQKDWPVALEPIKGSRGVLYRVRVGPYTSEARGKTVLASMGQEGFREARLVRE